MEREGQREIVRWKDRNRETHTERQRERDTEIERQRSREKIEKDRNKEIGKG